MRTILLLCASLQLGSAVTLEEYARGKVVPVYTIHEGVKIPFDGVDQTNNLGEGDKVVILSRLELTSVEGISGLRVVDGGRETRLSEVENLNLYLNNNAISALPAEFFTLQNLKFLYFYYNRLDAIPTGLARMKGLLGMYFTGNNISSIPPEIFSMTWLKKLQVSKNHLTELPAAIGNLTQLYHLNLSDNQIAELPESIGRLTKLRVCDFSRNRISRIPESFGKVRIMHQLRVIDNPLTTLPEGFADMPGSIDITGTKIDPARLSPGLRARISTEKVYDKDKKAAQDRLRGRQ